MILALPAVLAVAMIAEQTEVPDSGLRFLSLLLLTGWDGGRLLPNPEPLSLEVSRKRSLFRGYCPQSGGPLHQHFFEVRGVPGLQPGSESAPYGHILLLELCTREH